MKSWNTTGRGSKLGYVIALFGKREGNCCGGKRKPTFKPKASLKILLHIINDVWQVALSYASGLQVPCKYGKHQLDGPHGI
jgi:hypothetical protein